MKFQKGFMNEDGSIAEIKTTFYCDNKKCGHPIQRHWTNKEELEKLGGKMTCQMCGNEQEDEVGCPTMHELMNDGSKMKEIDRNGCNREYIENLRAKTDIVIKKQKQEKMKISQINNWCYTLANDTDEYLSEVGHIDEHSTLNIPEFKLCHMYANCIDERKINHVDADIKSYAGEEAFGCLEDANNLLEAMKKYRNDLIKTGDLVDHDK